MKTTMKTTIENIAKSVWLAAEVTERLEFFRPLFNGGDAVYSEVWRLILTTCLAVYFFVSCKSTGRKKSAGSKKTARRRRDKNLKK